MLPVSQAKLDHALDKYREALNEQTRLTGERAEIDRLRGAAQRLPDDPARGALGADGLWQDWLLQRRADIQTRLAMNRARQMELLARARDAFGRHQAVQDLCDAGQQENRRAAKRRSDDALGALLVLSRAERE